MKIPRHFGNNNLSFKRKLQSAPPSGFSTVETENSWREQRRELERRRYQQSRLERDRRRDDAGDSGYQSTDWVACQPSSFVVIWNSWLGDMSRSMSIRRS